VYLLDSSSVKGKYMGWSESVPEYRSVLETDAATITKLDTETFNRESWKAVYFGVKRSKFNVSRHKKQCWHEFCEYWLHVVYASTVKPVMFACPLFRELNKAAKLKGVNIDTVPTSIGVTHVLELCGLNLPK